MTDPNPQLPLKPPHIDFCCTDDGTPLLRINQIDRTLTLAARTSIHWSAGDVAVRVHHLDHPDVPALVLAPDSFAVLVDGTRLPLMAAVRYLADRRGEPAPLDLVLTATGRPGGPAGSVVTHTSMYRYGVLTEQFNQSLRDSLQQMAAGMEAARRQRRRSQ